jgi:hypothetical protein
MTPWIGVNESGLALAATGDRRRSACVAHAALLARDCLERFESVESALSWCLGRPCAMGGSLLMADAAGELAGVEMLATGREVRRADSGVLVMGGGASELAKKLALHVDEAAPPGVSLASLLSAELGGEREAASYVDVSWGTLRATGHTSQSATARDGAAGTRP